MAVLSEPTLWDGGAPAHTPSLLKVLGSVQRTSWTAAADSVISIAATSCEDDWAAVVLSNVQAVMVPWPFPTQGGNDYYKICPVVLPVLV
eukprot:jgi/Chrzof1/12290/Cz06g29020.t1